MGGGVRPIHLSQARRILNSRAPCDLVVVTSKGKAEEWPDVVSGRYDEKTGTRTMRFRKSGQCRRLRDVCILSINGHEVYL